jgi:hypothetical protein
MAGYTRQGRPIWIKEEQFHYATAADHYWQEENCGKSIPRQPRPELSFREPVAPQPVAQPAMATLSFDNLALQWSKAIADQKIHKNTDVNQQFFSGFAAEFLNYELPYEAENEEGTRIYIHI